MTLALVRPLDLLVVDEIEDIMPREPNEREKLMAAVNFLLVLENYWPHLQATVFASNDHNERIKALERIMADRAYPELPPPPPIPHDLGKVTETGSWKIPVEEARARGYYVTPNTMAALKKDAGITRVVKAWTKSALKDAYGHIITAIIAGLLIELGHILYPLLQHR